MKLCDLLVNSYENVDIYDYEIIKYSNSIANLSMVNAYIMNESKCKINKVPRVYNAFIWAQLYHYQLKSIVITVKANDNVPTQVIMSNQTFSDKMLTRASID